jgi:hypothetical protein
MTKRPAGSPIEVNYKANYEPIDPNIQLPPPLQGKWILVGNPFIGLSAPVRPITAKRGQHIMWGIINYTDEDVSVRVDDFQPKSGDATIPIPIVFIGQKQKTVQAGSVNKIKANVRPTAAIGEYTYNVYINNAAASDPELDIEH